MSALGTTDLARFRGRLRVEKLLTKLCQPFLLNDATEVCLADAEAADVSDASDADCQSQSLKLSVSGGNFFGNTPPEASEFTQKKQQISAEHQSLHNLTKEIG